MIYLIAKLSYTFSSLSTLHSSLLYRKSDCTQKHNRKHACRRHQIDRRENIRRIAEVCKLFTSTGVITLAAFVSPTRDLRRMAAEIIGRDDFVEIYVSTPIEECERRDVKGLYAKARRGELADFTGLSAPFEAPDAADIVIDTSHTGVDECVRQIMGRLAPRIVPAADMD